MSKKLKLIFMGTPEFAVQSLDILYKNGYEIAAVITSPDKPAGRGQKIQTSAVKDYAVANGLKIMQPEKLKDPVFLEELKSLNADLQIVVAFRMLPEVVWNMPPLGTLNLHASLLPQYRGAAPINRAIMNGEKETGVTTFFLQHEIDTGNIIMQEKIAIEPDETAGELHDKLMILGAKTVLETVNRIEKNEVNPQPQEELISGELKAAPKIFKEDCKINWNNSAETIHNFIRGLSPYPAAWTEFGDDKNNYSLKVFKASYITQEHTDSIGSILTENKKTIKVAVKNGYVELLSLQLSGKKRMSTEEFLRGFSLNTEFKFL